MARLARLSIEGWPHLVLQRVHEGQTMVRDDTDRAALLDALREAARLANVSIHAYSIGADRLLLLATPHDAQGLSRMMQAFGRRYVAIFNRRHSRSGSLWAERFRTTVIEPSSHLLDGMAYVELDPLGCDQPPVPGSLAERAAADHGSSAAHHLGQRSDVLVSDHPVYWALGNTPFEREAAYRKRLGEGLSATQRAAITDALHKGWALGSEAFRAELAKHCKRRLTPLRRGRPRKTTPPAPLPEVESVAS